MATVQPTSGTDYGALYQNNPYRNYQYTPSFWDRIGSAINSRVGFNMIKTNQMKVADEMANNAAVTDAQIAEIQREEMYNSAGENAQRMREAGINPDLQMSGVTGGEASPFDNQATSAMPDFSGPDSGDMPNFVRGLVGLIPSVTGMLTAFPELATSINAAKSSHIQAVNSLNSFIDDWIYRQYSAFSGINTQSDFLNSDAFSKFMNDPQVKELIPSYSKRKSTALVMFDKAKSLESGIRVDETRGKYLSGHTDPMNFDETLVKMINTVNSQYLLLSAQYQKELYAALSANDEAAARNAANRWQSMQDNAYIAMVEYLANLQQASGNQKYGLAIMQIDLMRAGKLGGAAGLGIAGMSIEKLKNFFGLSSQTPQPSSEGNDPQSLTPSAPEPPSTTPSVPTAPSTSSETTVEDWLKILFGGSNKNAEKRAIKRTKSIYPRAGGFKRLSLPPDVMQRRQEEREFNERQGRWIQKHIGFKENGGVFGLDEEGKRWLELDEEERQNYPY